MNNDSVAELQQYLASNKNINIDDRDEVRIFNGDKVYLNPRIFRNHEVICFTD